MVVRRASDFTRGQKTDTRPLGSGSLVEAGIVFSIATRI